MKQEVYNAIADIHVLALKVMQNPQAYDEFEDEFYEANKSLGNAWMALRAVKREQALNKVDDAAMQAKLKLAGL